MHPCLRVDEIIRLVAYELVGSEAEGTAAAFALCCKSFEEPVLDVLWEVQDRLTPLLKCLPEDTWEVCGGFKFVSHLVAFAPSAVNQVWKTFKRTPTKAEWAGFRKHALRMRDLQLDPTRDPEISDLLLVQQSHTTNDPWLPRLQIFYCDDVTEQLIPLIPFFLSPRTTNISLGFDEDLPTAVIGSVITMLPMLCPDIGTIGLDPLPKDPVIIKAVSEMLLACKRDRLRAFLADSPLTEEAQKEILYLPKLSHLHVVIEGSALLPRLPNLTTISITFDRCLDWLEGFRGANLAKLECVGFFSTSEGIGDLFGAFERVALTTPLKHSLSNISFRTPHPWNPNYWSLLPFTQLEELSIEFSCDGICSSGMDDDVLVELARAMPKLKVLELGDAPCNAFAGVTAKGLLGLARNCRHLSALCIHFRVDSVVESVGTQEALSGSDDETAAGKHDCALTDLEVGRTPTRGWKRRMIAKALLQIFPRLRNIKTTLPLWWRVWRDIHSLQQPAS